MSDEKEMHTSPVYPTPSQAPPPAPAPVYPVPVPAQVPPVYPTPVHPVYPASVPAPVPAKVETPYTYPTTTVPPPPVPVSVPVAPVSGKQYQDQVLAPCAAGHHDPTTKFGTCGIITAICCFPIGLLCLCADKETRCARCGVLLL